MDGNWPAQWFMVGTNANTVTGATVIDDGRGLYRCVRRTGQERDPGFGAYRDHCRHRVKLPLPAQEDIAVTWKPGEHYALDWGSEPEGLLCLYAAPSTPGGRRQYQQCELRERA